MPYKAVIFDLFGTLVDIFSRREYENVVAEMASHLKAPYDSFYKIWLQTGPQRGNGSIRTSEENLEYICRELKIHVSASQVAAARRARFDYVARALTPRQGAIETLSKLKTDGYKIGLISNCSTEPPIIWPNTPFAPFFDVTVFSSVACLQKPDPNIYLLAAKQLSVKPQDCLFIGDGDDLELTGALEVGMHPVLIRTIHDNSTDVMRNTVEVERWQGPVIKSLKEVLNLVK